MPTTTYYVVDPNHSTPAWFDTEEAAQACADANNGVIVPEAQVHPEYRRPS